MGRYITLEKSDPKFRSYLLGSFSQKEIALPVESLHVDTVREQVTFHIFDRDEIKRPSRVRIFASLFRLDMLSLTLLPPAVVLVRPAWMLFWPPPTLLVTMFACLAFLHAAVFALNDYVDHIKGLDRLSDRAGSRIIQQGFLTAREVLLTSFFMLGLAVIASVPVLARNPLLLFVGLLGIFLGSFGYSYARTGMRRLVVGGVSVFVAFGPLLVFGTAALVSPAMISADWRDLSFLSFLFGFSTLIYLHVRQLSTLMVDHLGQVKTLAVRLGFDRAKKWIFMQHLILQGVFLYYWNTQTYRLILWVPAAAVCVTGLWLAFQVLRLPSPLSSRSRPLAQQHIQLHSWMGGVLVLATFYPNFGL